MWIFFVGLSIAVIFSIVLLRGEHGRLVDREAVEMSNLEESMKMINGEIAWRLFEKRVKKDGKDGDIEAVEKAVEEAVDYCEQVGLDREDFYYEVEWRSGLNLRELIDEDVGVLDSLKKYVDNKGKE